MSDIQLTKLQLIEGVWSGILKGPSLGGGVPDLRVTHNNLVVEDVKVQADPENDGWRVTIPVPLAAISDGVQTVLISDPVTNLVLGNFTLLAGEVFDDDLRTEVGLLRAELDLLKRAFRRHCVETM